MKYIQTIEVTPARSFARFPIDMLRYDRCFPATETDSNAIAESQALDILSAPGRSSVGTIRVVRYISNKTHPLTIGRWNSFGWIVEVKETRKL